MLNAEGEVELDASIMDGSNLAIGAVGAVKGLRHPISIARLLLAETPVLLVGDGAQRFAARHGAERAETGPAGDPQGPSSPAADTVGCVALDTSGHMAAGLSTGGLSGKLPGRLGDTPLPGCGFYADDQEGGVAFSGDGESIARTLLAATVMQRLALEAPQAALEASLRLGRVGGEAGGIAFSCDGRFGCAHTSEHFAVALASERVPLRAAVHQRDLQDLFHD